MALFTGSDYLRGARKAQEERREANSNFGPDMRELRLFSGDLVDFEFITDADDMVLTLVHNVRRISKKSNKPWFKSVQCSRESLEDRDTPCVLCDTDLEDEKGYPLYGWPKLKPFFLVWVNTHIHSEDTGKKYSKNPEAWEPIKTKNGTMWREEVNDIMYLEVRPSLEASIFEYIDGDTLDVDAEPLSLLNKVFKMKAVGFKTERKDSIDALADTEGLSVAARGAFEEAPELTQIVTEHLDDPLLKENSKVASDADDNELSDVDVDVDEAVSDDDLKDLPF